MTEQEVRAAYAEKYKAFPDLVERILGQLDYKFWSRDNEDEEIELDTFRDWTETMEGSKFWGIISRGKLTREKIDAAYAEFGIENTNQAENKRDFKHPVAMPCTHDQFEEELKEPLINLGYKVDAKLFSRDLITNVWNGSFKIALINQCDASLDSRHFIGFNPELFLALAAMSEGDFWPGEYVCFKGKSEVLGKIDGNSGEWCRVVISDGCFEQIRNIAIRKATASEIIEHFTKKEEVPTPPEGRMIREGGSKEPSFFDQVAAATKPDKELLVGVSNDPKYSPINVLMHETGEVEITFNGVKYIRADAKILNETLKEAEKLHMPKVNDEIYVWDAEYDLRGKRRFAFILPDGKVATYNSNSSYEKDSKWSSVTILIFNHYARLDEPVFVPMEKAKEKFADIYGIPASLIVIEE